MTERFPSQWEASSPAGLCTGNNSAFLSFRTPKHDFWGGAGDLELLTVDASLLDGVVTVEEVGQGEWRMKHHCDADVIGGSLVYDTWCLVQGSSSVAD